MKTPVVPPEPRLVTDTPLAGRILDNYHQRIWPVGLVRFKLFTRDRDHGCHAYRAVAWEPESRSLYVLRISLSSPVPTGTGEWQRWRLSDRDNPLSDVHLISDTITPIEISDLSKPMRPSSLAGMERRKSILQAFCFVDVQYDGQTTRMFNPLVLSDPAERSAAVRYVCERMQQPLGYQTYVLELFHRFVFFGGSTRAMAKLTSRQGGPSKTRVGMNTQRPGPSTDAESRAATRTAILGAPKIARRGPVRPSDIDKFTWALQEFHIDGKQNLKTTYASMVSTRYCKRPKRLVPSISQFFYHARTRLLEQQDAERRRLGPRLTAQYATSRPGQASAMTFGFNLEVVDVDGFVAKIPIAALINMKIEPVLVQVVFAVSRRTGAVVGYEIAMKGENSEAFRRCIASIFVSKEARAKELGLTDFRGLLHGCIDAIFVDNGAGAAADVIETACKEMDLIQFFAPPARGDLKAVGESLNNVMVNLMKDLTGAFTRQRDIFSKELRRIKRADKPVTLEQFERFLLMAIQHVNLFSNKPHLRSEPMRQDHKNPCSIHPHSLWHWYQNRPAAGQRAKLEPWEAWERFIPWKDATVSAGKIRFLRQRWTSPELAALYDAHMSRPAKKRGRLNIEIKRVGAHATTLKWRGEDGRGGDLHLIDEDAFMLGKMTWKELELRNADDAFQAEASEPANNRSRNRLTSKQQNKVAAAERRRNATVETAFGGPTITEARRNAVVRRDAARFAAAAAPSQPDAHETSAGPMASIQSEVFDRSSTEILLPVERDDTYVDELGARLLALAQSVGTSSHR